MGAMVTRVVISGATGLIGRALESALVAAGHQVIRLTRRPVVAIGGVTADNAAEALAAGAHGVAVLSFAACSPDPATAVRRLREAIEAFRAEGVGRGAR